VRRVSNASISFSAGKQRITPRDMNSTNSVAASERKPRAARALRTPTLVGNRTVPVWVHLAKHEARLLVRGAHADRGQHLLELVQLYRAAAVAINITKELAKLFQLRAGRRRSPGERGDADNRPPPRVEASLVSLPTSSSERPRAPPLIAPFLTRIPAASNVSKAWRTLKNKKCRPARPTPPRRMAPSRGPRPPWGFPQRRRRRLEHNTCWGRRTAT
jgi:hypothetical protein